MGQIILSRDVRWLIIMWNAYMKKQRRLNQNLEESDSNSEDDDDSYDDNSVRKLDSAMFFCIFK